MKCHRTTPTATETFKECLVPNCGISKEKSEASTTSWLTPSTSFPNIKAYFSVPEPSEWPAQGLNFSKLTEATVCSTLTTVYPCSRSLDTTSSVSLAYSQGTLSSAPRADLRISADGGVAQIPQRNSLSALNESHVRKAEPT